jgi:hypothetical protein
MAGQANAQHCKALPGKEFAHVAVFTGRAVEAVHNQTGSFPARKKIRLSAFSD